jgi:transcriptional regulator with XRE-family HTH domain
MAAKKNIPKPRGAAAPKQMQGLPERLRRAMRLNSDITQLSLQSISGVSQSAISSLLTGASLDNVTMGTVARLAIALRASLDWLVLGIGDDIPRLVDSVKAGGAAVSLSEKGDPPLLPPPATPPTARKRFPRHP